MPALRTCAFPNREPAGIEDAMNTPQPHPADSARHGFWDNIQGQVFGIVMTAFGVSILRAAGLVTGQTAGLSLLVSYATDLSFGAAFFLINLPFFIFAWRRLGAGFALRSVISTVAISVLVDLAPMLIVYASLDMLTAAILGGCASGFGLIALFRHGASAGGLGILAVYLQDRTGFRAGWTQLIVDSVIFAASFLVLDWKAVIVSFLGAVVLNVMIAFNHRRDWYVAH
jgi:uncharacterized membrane-anchored protein YitT (DUF2179 family)